MRADQLLVARGLAPTRSAAQRLIAQRAVRWLAPGGWAVPRKPGEDLPTGCSVEVTDDAELRYVSRGGLKLAAALDRIGVDPTGCHALDLGQSTGGFTDVLLQRGAVRVVGVDVGHGQLHARLAADPRVVAFEGLHVRALASAAPDATSPSAGTDVDADAGSPPAIRASRLARPGEREAARDAPPASRSLHEADAFAAAAPRDGFDVIVADLSFISLTHALPVVARWLHPAGHAVLLTKPQFELQPADIGKGGLVRDPAARARVESRIRAACEAVGLCVRDYFESAIAGGDGNREFFTWAGPRRDPDTGGSDPRRASPPTP